MIELSTPSFPGKPVVDTLVTGAVKSTPPVLCPSGLRGGNPARSGRPPGPRRPTPVTWGPDPRRVRPPMAEWGSGCRDGRSRWDAGTRRDEWLPDARRHPTHQARLSPVGTTTGSGSSRGYASAGARTHSRTSSKARAVIRLHSSTACWLYEPPQ